MIPNSDQLAAISHMRAGDLAEIPFAVLLHALAAHQRSVVLEIERMPMKKEIILENGVPVDCRSNFLHETLPRFMVSQGRITEQESQEYVAKAAQRGLQFGEALILEGLIDASELYKILQQNLARKLLDGFTWRSGDFRVLSDLPPVDSPLKVKVPQLVVTGVAKFALDDEVNGAVGPLVGKRLFLHPDPAFTLDEIRLSGAQGRLLEMMDGGKRIDELAAETTIPFDQIMRLLYSLAIIGIVVPEDWLPQPGAAPKLTAPSRVAPAAPAAAAAEAVVAETSLPTQEVERLRNRIMEAFLRHRKQDAIDLLGLAEDASMLDIRNQYLRMSRLYAPWQFEGPQFRGLREKAEDLFVAVGQAFGDLSDTERRNSLLQRRKQLREERQRKPAADRFAIRSNLLDPAVQFKKGKALMQAGKFRDAEQQLQFALDCDPQNTTYRAELAYCRFRANPSSEGQQALDDLRETLRIDPKCGLAIYFSGMVNLELENFEAAESQLQQSIKLLMPDRRPIEGLKTLQSRAKKKKRGLLG